MLFLFDRADTDRLRGFLSWVAGLSISEINTSLRLDNQDLDRNGIIGLMDCLTKSLVKIQNKRTYICNRSKLNYYRIFLFFYLILYIDASVF